MNLSMWSSYFCELTPEAMVEAFVSGGWEYSELSDEHARTLLERGSPEKTGAEFKRFAADRGFSFPQGHFYLEADIAHPEKKERERILEELKRWCSLFHALGITEGVIHPGGSNLIKHGEDRTKLLEINLEPLGKLLEFTAGGPTTICLENLRGIFTTADDLLSLVEAAGSKGLGICLDTGHLNMNGRSCADFVVTAGKKLRALHITDSIGGEVDHILPYGAGTTDWAIFTKALEETGYNGLFNFEVPRERLCPMPVKLAKLDYCLELAKIMTSGRALPAS